DWYATAVDNYDRAIEAGGERSFHLVLRAVCVARLGNFDQAKEDIQEALALEPKSGWRLFYAAQVYTLAGDRAEAFRHVDLALEAGYARQQFMREPAFEDYRGDTEFLALLESPAS
ncbi:MAG: hypothetical protein OES47_10785, partial [Acidobacteriota bacterium]|nr:hypothetical protein [Acidobacteriota bacterium]